MRVHPGVAQICRRSAHSETDMIGILRMQHCNNLHCRSSNSAPVSAPAGTRKRTENGCMQRPSPSQYAHLCAARCPWPWQPGQDLRKRCRPSGVSSVRRMLRLPRHIGQVACWSSGCMPAPCTTNIASAARADPCKLRMISRSDCCVKRGIYQDSLKPLLSAIL